MVIVNDFIMNVEAAEARMVSFTLEWTCKRGWKSIIIESIAQTVIRLLSNSGSLSLSHWKSFSYLQKCLSLKSSFSSISFVWVPRQANLATHHLCRWAWSVN